MRAQICKHGSVRWSHDTHDKPNSLVGLMKKHSMQGFHSLVNEPPDVILVYWSLPNVY